MVALKDVMSRHYESVHPDAPAREALRQMNALNLSMLPVCDGRRVVGMLAEPPEGADGADGKAVRDVMTLEILIGHEDQDVRDVIAVMRTRDIRTLPVLDRSDELVGIFTLGGPWKRSGPGPRRVPSG